MRYYRASKPNGTYKDIKGTSPIFSQYQMNYGPSAASNAGTRLFGSYKWSSMNDAELSQGHNSALQDDDGKAYLIYHTRFANGGEGHQLRVHQLFLNSNDWLVASPYEFTGCEYNQDSINARQKCSASDIVGTYQLMEHPYKLDYKNKAYQKEAQIYLSGDGKVTGDYIGTWKITTDGKSYFTIKIAKKGSATQTQYTGVILPQIVSETNMPSVCFTAVATTGVTIWGTNIDGKYAVDYNYQKVKDSLPVKAGQLIKTDIDLSVPTYFGAEISWSSDSPNLISDDGKLMVTPTTSSEDSVTNVTLTFRIMKDKYYYELNRIVRVRCSEADAINAVGTEKPKTVMGVYDLSGKRVADSPSQIDIHTIPKGIYIINGKKVLFK